LSPAGAYEKMIKEIYEELKTVLNEIKDPFNEEEEKATLKKDDKFKTPNVFTFSITDAKKKSDDNQ
jgi:hypothetical protein